MSPTSPTVLRKLTCPRTAAAFGAAWAAEVTATRVRAALTPADSNEQQQQQEAKNHQDNQEPVCRGENRG